MTKEEIIAMIEGYLPKAWEEDKFAEETYRDIVREYVPEPRKFKLLGTVFTRRYTILSTILQLIKEKKGIDSR